MKDQQPEKEFLVLKCHLDVTPAEAFRAWSDPTELAQWWGPEEGDKSVVVDIDVRPGGSYHIVTNALSGDEYDFSGEYREVVPNKKVSFTWATGHEKGSSTVTAELASEGDGTNLVLTHQGLATKEERDGCRKGWQGALQKLERQLNT